VFKITLPSRAEPSHITPDTALPSLLSDLVVDFERTHQTYPCRASPNLAISRRAMPGLALYINQAKQPK
jgi:hypothetical protein